MVKCNVVAALSRDDALECFSVKDALRQDCCSVGFGSETSMSLRSQCQIALCDACFHFGADSCSDGRSLLWLPCVGELLHGERGCVPVEREAFSQALEREERQRFGPQCW